eukprot:1397270-Prymnesium_polylepis.1
MSGRVGCAGFARMSLVCKSFYAVTRGSKPLLRAVACYTGGLDRPTFSALFAVPISTVATLPQYEVQRGCGRGFYYIILPDDINEFMSSPERSLEEWGERLRERRSCTERGRYDDKMVRKLYIREERLRRRFHRHDFFGCKIYQIEGGIGPKSTVWMSITMISKTASHTVITCFPRPIHILSTAYPRPIHGLSTWSFCLFC